MNMRALASCRQKRTKPVSPGVRLDLRSTIMNPLSRSVVVGTTRVLVELHPERSVARIHVTDGGVPRVPVTIGIEPYMKAGLSLEEALDHLVEISRDSVEVAMLQNQRDRSCH